MPDRNLVRGLCMVAIAVIFGLPSLRYPIGRFDRAGPGLFPLLVSGLLLLLGVSAVLRSRFTQRVPLNLGIKHIGLIVTSLCGFALISTRLNAVVGIAFMVFCSALAGKSYSLTRNLGVTVALIGVAVVFQKLLGLDLPLY